MGHWCGYSAVRHCMGMRICHVSFADVFVTDDIFYFTGAFRKVPGRQLFTLLTQMRTLLNSFRSVIDRENEL